MYVITFYRKVLQICLDLLEIVLPYIDHVNHNEIWMQLGQHLRQNFAVHLPYAVKCRILPKNDWIFGNCFGNCFCQSNFISFWYEVFTYGGKKSTGIDAIAWAKKASMMGAGEILLTSIDADGTKDGYEITLTKAVSKAVSVPVIASGGCGTLQHMADVLQNSGADAALAASIFHYDSHGLCTAKQFLKDQGISVRPCDKML